MPNPSEIFAINEFFSSIFMMDVPDGLGIFVGVEANRILQESELAFFTLLISDFGLGSYHAGKFDDGGALL
jgi:hypothetical protein